MAAVRRNPVALSDANRKLLEDWTQQFDRNWDEGRLPAWVRQLPPSESPLRLAALLELVKIDLRRHWLAGRERTVEYYLKDHPELAASKDVLLDLALHEYDVRREAGKPARPAEFAPRFPRIAGELTRRLEEAQASRTPVPTTVQPPPQTVRQGEPTGAPGDLPERFGRYRIVRLLGRGGMGSVYLAQDTQLDRPVALKVPHFRVEDGQELLERFHREARSAALLHHPNLCPVYDVNELNGTHYLTMAFVEGKPLSEFVAPDRRLPQRQVATVIRKMALALEYAHQQGIIHRDLKPSNVMLTAKGEPVIMDFGLARRTDGNDPRLTKAGSLLGTPAYMAPEQVNGELTIGPPADVYSVGVILYELLTGKLPFDGNPGYLVALILTQEPPPPSARRPDLDPPLDPICRKAMAKRVPDRYRSMDELAEALAAYLREPEAPPAPKPRPAEKPRSSGGPIPLAKLVPAPSADIPAALPVGDAGAGKKSDPPRPQTTPRPDNPFTDLPVVTAVPVGTSRPVPPPLPAQLPRRRRRSVLRTVLLVAAAVVGLLLLLVMGCALLVAVAEPGTGQYPEPIQPFPGMAK
jgi:serine/threonine protein kinase